MADLDGDERLEAPYVTSQGEIRIVDATNETQFVAGSTLSSKSKLGVADWTGDGTPEVLYGNTSDNKHIYYANVSGTPTEIVSQQANAVLGAVDFDGNGTRDIVYVGTSQVIHYYDVAANEDNKVKGVGQTSGGLGVGTPVKFYGNDEYWVPMMGGSSYTKVVNASGNPIKLSSTSMTKAPVAGVDWVGDAQLEGVHLNATNMVVYTRINGATKAVKDANGDILSADHSAGVAGVASYPEPLSVSDFEATATGEQNVTVNVTTNHDLESLNVTLGGPESATLTLADGDFEETGTNPYTYTATYDGSTDGEYTATLESAASAGDSVSPSNTSTATVDDVSPTVESANLSDATDGDGVVAPGDRIEVDATVTGDVGTVTANLSAFDAGSNVSLTHASGDEYNATVEVGENATEGDWNATVTASDGQGNEDSADTNALTVDTTLSVSLPDSRTVEEGEQAEYSPKSVSNADGSVTYEWEFGSTNKSGENVTHTFENPGEYTVNLTVTDGDGDTANASMTVTVEDVLPSVDSASLTDATDGDGIVAPGDRIEVNATATGEVETVTANLSAFDAGSNVSLTHASGDKYNVTVEVGEGAIDGEQRVTVTASDDDGNENSTETGVLTVDTDELSVRLGDSRTVDEGEQVEYGPPSVSNATGDVTYDWTFGDNATPTGENVTYTFENPGDYTVNLTASDESGDVANASLSVTVEDVLPSFSSVSLTDETDGDGVVAPGDKIEVNATVSGEVDGVSANLSAFDAGESVELTHASGDRYNATVEVGQNATVGNQRANVTASDDDGNTNVTETGTLTVDAGDLTVALDDARTVPVNETVTFSPSDVSNTTDDVTYDWTFGDGGTATGRSAEHAFEKTGTYTVNLTVSDESRETANASMTVTVDDTAPVVEAVNILDATDGNGIVVPGDEIEVSATVSGTVENVTANLTAFGVGSVALANASGDEYTGTFEIEADARDGKRRAAVVAVDGEGDTDAEKTGTLIVDTDELAVEVAGSPTVDTGESVEFAPDEVVNATGDVDYEWTFGNSTAKTGEVVSYAFDRPGDYTVELVASDASGDTATDSMVVTVEDGGTTTNPTSDSSGSGSTGGTGGDVDLPATTTTAGDSNTTTQPTTTGTTAELATTEPTTEGGTATNRTTTEGTSDATTVGQVDRTPGEAPGFGAVAALLALGTAAGLALRP